MPFYKEWCARVYAWVQFCDTAAAHKAKQAGDKGGKPRWQFAAVAEQKLSDGNKKLTIKISESGVPIWPIAIRSEQSHSHPFLNTDRYLVKVAAGDLEHVPT